MEMVSFCLDTCFQNGNGSILFGYSFQLIWKLSLDWYPNQMEAVSILEICFQISWTLVSIMDTSCGYPFWVSDHWKYVVSTVPGY